MSDAKHVLNLLKRSGSVYEGQTGKQHPKWRLPNGQHYTLPCNPRGNEQAWKNSYSLLKKLLKPYMPELNKDTAQEKSTAKTKEPKQKAGPSLSQVRFAQDDKSVEMRTLQSQLVDAGIAKPAAEVMRPFRHRYSEEKTESPQQGEEKQVLRAEDQGARDDSGDHSNDQCDIPLRWHSIKPRPLGQKRDNRRCLVATPEVLARANEIMKTEGEAAYREFMKNPEIKSKLEEKDIPMAAKRTSPPPTVTIPVRHEREEAPKYDPLLAAVEAARHALLTIDSEIQQEYLLSEQHTQKAKALEGRKKDLNDTIDAYRLLKETAEKHADLLKPAAPAREETRTVPKLITSHMVLTECASLLDRSSHGATNDEIFCRFTENYPGIEDVVDRITISQRTSHLCDKGMLERVAFGLYSYSEEAQKLYGLKKEKSANGHAADSATIVGEAGQSTMLH